MTDELVSHYRILRPMAGTGKDDLYLAEDVNLGREVALKFLPPALAEDAEALQRFGREARTLAESSSHGTLLGIETDKDRTFLVLVAAHAEELLPKLHDLETHTATNVRVTRPADSQTTRAVHSPTATFSPGQILGDRYRIVSQIGRGGMGEVWHAFDVKLQVEVALKSLRAERFSGEGALELLRREVRAARGVISPNVCRIFDLVVEEGQELVSMEYIDGQTLMALLQTRSPLELSEAQAIAAQLLAGLDAIHAVGLVHRDIKPENIMITRSGRVVIMDFGVAKGVTQDSSSTVSGTPAYMAPEQMSGEALDGRADIFSTGIVLAEMTSVGGVHSSAARDDIMKGVHKNPPRLPEGPWRTVLERAVAPDRERRHASAATLARALEEITLRVEGAEDKRPYPGLASFTAADTEYFYGREAEVEAVWKRLRRANLLAIVGASGAGKTSFVQAGLVPAMPDGWSHAICHPGAAPFVALGEALAVQLSGDFESLRQLLRFDDPSVAVSMFARWRQRHTEALLIIDQFEELFTQNPPEVQLRVTELLGSLASESDVRVLLCMRDDFFMRCHEFPALAAVFSELTPLGPPTGASLRRALVQPAASCGYRFEDENLVDDMLSQVGEERGALPLLAFTVSRLWENRDRDKGQLTRAAYESIGGVGGALARHAETTLERIGSARHPLVREIFRNLVTAAGTRASMDMETLLSIFAEEEHAVAREILRELIDARLLTSFERLRPGEEEAAPKQQIEIIHESLLTSWPRLVRWRTQDADSAQLRDQLRQATQLWEERSRSDDMLWTGTAFHEFQIWRERYPGGLTETEDAFADAMMQRAERQRRRRRRLTIAAFAVLLATLGVIGTFWRQAEVQRLGAEASKLHSLGQLELERFPSRALAYAIASLELRDDPEVRRFAIEALWKGPSALVFERDRRSNTVNFSPDGQSIAIGDNYRSRIKVWSSQAIAPITLCDTTIQATYGVGYPRFGASGAIMAGFWRPDVGSSPLPGGSIRLWSLTDHTVVSHLSFQGETLAYLGQSRRYLMAITEQSTPDDTELQVWDVENADPKLIGQIALDVWGPVGGISWTTSLSDIDPTGTWLVYAEGTDLKVVALSNMQIDPPRIIGRHEGDITSVAFHPDGKRVVALSLGEVHVWSRTSQQPDLLQHMKGARGGFGLHIDPRGNWLAVPFGDGRTQLWDLKGPPGQEPLELRYDRSQAEGVAFHPNGQWVVTGNAVPAFWPLKSPYPRVLRGDITHPTLPIFAPDGSWLASVAGDSIRLWGLSPDIPDRALASGSNSRFQFGLLVDPQMRFLAFYDASGMRKISLSDGHIEELPFDMGTWSGAIDPSGRYIAAGYAYTEGGRIQVLDLTTGEMQLLELGKKWVNELQFTLDGHLLSVIGTKLVRWNLQDGSHEVLMENVRRFDLSRDEHHLLTIEESQAVFHDLKNGVARVLTSHGSLVRSVALDATGTLAITGDARGDVRVGPVTGEEPHLLVGHKGPIHTTPSISLLSVDPKGRWIASAAEEEVARILLWSMPEGEPINGLPPEQFLARLKTLTNLRVIPTVDSPTGYGIEYTEFPGWETVPTW